MSTSRTGSEIQAQFDSYVTEEVVITGVSSTTAAAPIAGGVGAAAGAWDTALNNLITEKGKVIF